MIYDYIKRVSAAKTLGETTSYRAASFPTVGRSFGQRDIDQKTT
jgi:hypothetical protein